jgi:hypothetical protein
MRKRDSSGDGGRKKNLSPAHTVQKKFLAIRKTFTLAPSEEAAGEINNEGDEKTGGYPNGGEISLSRQRSPRELCGAGRRRARRTRERAVAAGRGGGQHKAGFIHTSV